MGFTATETGIRDFIVTELLYDQELRDITAKDPMIGEGLLDSLAIVRIVAFCEETFGIEIPDEEVVPEHFENISAIAALVESRLSARK